MNPELSPTDPKYEIVVTSIINLTSIKFDRQHNVIVVLTQSQDAQTVITPNTTLVIDIISKRVLEKETKGIVFIAAEDSLDFDELTPIVQQLYKDKHPDGIALFIPYKLPPMLSQRDDGCVRSFLISPAWLRQDVLSSYFPDFKKLAYNLLFPYLNSARSKNIDIFQVGKASAEDNFTGTGDAQLLKRSLLIIPHTGSLALLKRCLLHVNQAPSLPGAINICFDDNGYQKFNADRFDRISNLLKVYANNPCKVGPYPGRHYSITDTSMEYIFFQDSDDIPVNARFEKQIVEMEKRDLDMVGSHELRIDQFEQQIMIFRYPLGVTEALAQGAFHPLFHPTALISKSAYLRTGGFSTDRRFGYDSQFLMRSHFYLRSGNIDDFLYIRFKRPNSLTTNAKTKLGSDLRTFLLWRWITEFRLVKENKLDLQDSSLSVQKHQFDYNMIDVKGMVK